MNLRRRQRPHAEVHASAMNDIMFFLMLFFLIASTVTNPNVVKLLLPKSSSGQSVSKRTVNISITKDVQYYIEKQPISLEELQPRLQGYQKQVQELTVILRAEQTVDIQDVVKVMDIANKLGLKMVLATDPK